METLIANNEERKCTLRSIRKESNQYRATRLWNDLIRDFQCSVFCKKHRRYLKTHDNCFTGAAAIDVMHTLLQINDNFSFEISRNQATKLLQKFLDEHIIESVTGKWENETFADNSKLYRFTITKYGDEHSRNILNGASPLLGSKKAFNPKRILSVLSSPIVQAASPMKEAQTRGIFLLKALKGDEKSFLPRCIMPKTD